MFVGMNIRKQEPAQVLLIHCESSGLWLSSPRNSSKQLEFEKGSLYLYSSILIGAYEVLHFFAAHCCAMSAEHNLPTALMHELQVTRLGIKAIRPGDVDMVALVAATLLLGKLFWNILNYFETAWRSEAASKHPKKICEIKTAQDMQDLSAIGT